MKLVLIILGILICCVVVLVVALFNRLGEPVNAALSDSYYYHAWKKKIIYSPMGNWFELGYEETVADLSTFQVLSREFGKDGNFVFWKGRQQSVDVASFEIDSTGTPRDAQHVYYQFTYHDSLIVIEGADPETYHSGYFSEATYYQRWGEDDRSVFLEGRKLDVDRATFVKLNETLAIDTNHIYIVKRNPTSVVDMPGATQILTKANNPGGVATAIDKYYGRVGNSIFFSNWKNDFTLHTFNNVDFLKIIDERNILVNNILLSDGNIISDVDLASFEVVNRDYLKDNKGVYYDTRKIEGADPQSFTLVFEDYAKDKHHVYFKDQLLAGADPTGFIYSYSNGIATDGKLSFKDGKLLQEKK